MDNALWSELRSALEELQLAEMQYKTVSIARFMRDSSSHLHRAGHMSRTSKHVLKRERQRVMVAVEHVAHAYARCAQRLQAQGLIPGPAAYELDRIAAPADEYLRVISDYDGREMRDRLEAVAVRRAG